MSFQPVIPATGIAGWRLLQRTQEKQTVTFAKDAELAREVKYFTDTIGKIKTAPDLVADRRLLKIALGAFGLEGDIAKKALIRKVLEGGTTDPKALASRMSDPSYKKLSAAFGFGDAGGAKTGAKDFAAQITTAYKIRAFEAAIGETDNDLRLALNFKREIVGLAAGEKGGSWFSILGSKSMRQVVEKAFNLPSAAFGKLDVDRQREILREKSNDMFGSGDLSVFKDAGNVEKLIDRFLARAQIEGGANAAGGTSSALTLLRNFTSGGSQGIFNLLSSKN